MGYTEELKELIKRVEATRPARLEKKKRGEELPMLTLAEREERLAKFHPDFNEGGPPGSGWARARATPYRPRSSTCWRPRAGSIPTRVDLTNPAYETDVLVIGGGGAGTAAALLARRAGPGS